MLGTIRTNVVGSQSVYNRRLPMAFRTAAMLAAFFAALAAAPAEAQGNKKDQDACRSDARRLCRSVLSEQMLVLDCLVKNQRRISRACRGVLERHGQL